MKKNILTILAAALVLMAVGCKKESEGVTRITYYPTIELQGDNPALVTIGGTFTDPGFTATMNGEDVSADVTVSDNIDNTAVGKYTVTYSIVNSDGISASATRNVYVVNPGGIDNVYYSYCRMGTRQYNFPILVTQYAAVPGSYMIEDLCGGYYCLGRYPGYEAYGYNFWATAVFTVTGTTINVLAVADWYFKSSFNMANFTGTYNATTGVLDYDYDGLLVTLTPYDKL